MYATAKIQFLLMDHYYLYDVMFLDYLQLLSSPGHDSRVQEVSHITRELKKFALLYEIPILALSQLNRALESQNREQETHIRTQPLLQFLREISTGGPQIDCWTIGVHL